MNWVVSAKDININNTSIRFKDDNQPRIKGFDYFNIHMPGFKTQLTDLYYSADSISGSLKELVAAGLSPAEALRTATIEPARYLGRNNEGEVRPGYRANLLILDGNPLENIEYTRAINSVVLNADAATRLRRRTEHMQLGR